ncbi:MAG: LysR family transcriptional regulator [Rhodobacteraceae bacterium]|nr:LysR family transcriptional regulator [Paracoccaceae bacterium]
MDNLDVLKTDFHALNVLVSVHQVGSLTKAAEELLLNQSTVSYTVERLRKTFDDPLFVKHGRGVIPTERCDALVRKAQDLVRQFAEMSRPATFDPAKSTERVVISCNSYERYVLLPRLINLIRRDAPHMRVAVISSGTIGHEQIEQGICDVLVSPVPAQSGSTYTRHLFSDRYTCFIARDQPHAAGLTLDAYCRAAHIFVRYDGNWRALFLDTLDQMGVSISPTLEIPSVGSAQNLIAGSDLILTAPARFAPMFADECVTVDAPFDTLLSEQMFWSARVHNDPKSQWLRGKIVAAASMLD